MISDSFNPFFSGQDYYKKESGYFDYKEEEEVNGNKTNKEKVIIDLLRFTCIIKCIAIK